MSALWFITLLGVLIAVHELGHLVAARLLGIGVIKFSIGFGPTLLAVVRGGTEYALSAVPFGGYVRLVGEHPSDLVSPEESGRAYCRRPAWQRLVVALAGPVANLLFPMLALTPLFGGTRVVLSSTIGSVLSGQPAALADLQPGDRVVSIDDRTIHTWEELNRIVTASPDRPLRLTVERSAPGGPRALTKYVTPRAHRRRTALGGIEHVGLLGVVPYVRLAQVAVQPGSAAEAAGLRTFDVITAIQGRAVDEAAGLEPLLNPRGGGVLLVSYLRPSPAPLGFASVASLSPGTAQVVPRPVAGPKGPRYESGVGPADLAIATVEPGTPAATLGGVGLRPGDLLLSLDNQPLGSWEVFAQLLEERPDEEHELVWRSVAGQVERGRFRLEARRQLDEYDAEATLHVFGAEGARARRPVQTLREQVHLPVAFGMAVGRTLSVTATLGRALGGALGGSGALSSLGGPQFLYRATGVAAEHGLDQLLMMAALVSINLGLINLLPVPLLDGGRVGLVLFEWVRRRRISPELERKATYAGFALLALLVLLASRNDLVRYFLRR
jgi:regulator of sigma E protease